jgi:hypothetical protein
MSKSNIVELSEQEKNDNRLKSPLNPHIVWMRNTGNSNSEFWHVHPNMGANATPINTMRPGVILGNNMQTHTEMALGIRKISEMNISDQAMALAKYMMTWNIQWKVTDLHSIDLCRYVSGTLLENLKNLKTQIHDLWFENLEDWIPIRPAGDLPFNLEEDRNIVYARVSDKPTGAYEWIHKHYTVYCDRDDVFIMKRCAEYCEEFEDWFLRGDMNYSPEQGEWIHADSETYVYCDDTDEYHIRENCYLDEERGWTSEPQGQRVLRYHGYSREVMKEPTDADWTIGFEIEKNSIYNEETRDIVNQEGDRVEKQPFFWKWETDSSCGIEGVSHAYDLFDSKEFKQDVENSPYIEGATSKRSGGHVSIKCNKWEQPFGLNDVRPYAGLIYALWRYRLKNEFCSKNKKIEADAYLDRYDVIRLRGNKFLEFRLPSRVQYKSQVIWRYKIFHLTIRAMVEQIPFSAYVRNCDSLLDEVYDAEKKERIKGLSQNFDDYLSLGVIASEISEFI